jgi:hypothetical protein
MHTIRVACRTRKPPASTVAAAVFGRAGTSDADDDADWERLVVSSSVQPDLQVRIETVTRDPLVLEVGSSVHAHALAAAFHLAMETQGRFV